MVTRKRRIETEEDRFGGYAEDNLHTGSAMHDRQDIFVIPQDDRSLTEKDEFGGTFSYSTRGSERIFARPTIKSDKKTVHHSQEDVMPSIKTMSYMERNQEKQVNQTREKMEGKTKVMLAVYMAIVVLLAAIVIGTGLAINSAKLTVDDLTARINTQNEVILGQDRDLAILNDESRIAGEAFMDGYVEDPGSSVLNLIPKNNEPKYETRSNAFDRFCDWLGRILGG